MADRTEDRTERPEIVPAAPQRALPAAEPAPDIIMGNGRPSDPDEIRQEIERTRERMSRTLDAIEDRLVQRKDEIWARATFRSLRHRVSSEPWRSLAIAFVVGYVVAAIRD
jgi:hypothetical protein